MLFVPCSVCSRLVKAARLQPEALALTPTPKNEELPLQTLISPSFPVGSLLSPQAAL